MKIGIVAFFIFVLCFTLCLFSTPAFAMSGNGTIIDPWIVTNISEFQDINSYMDAGLFEDGTGTSVVSPPYSYSGVLPSGERTFWIFSHGTFNITLAPGRTGIAESYGCTVNGSPVSLVSGVNIIDTLGATDAPIKITVNKSYFELANDVDASATVGWNAGQGFLPIGNSTLSTASQEFRDSFDGNGYTIDSLCQNYHNSGWGCAYYGSDDINIFSWIALNGEVKNVNFTNVSMTGNSSMFEFDVVSPIGKNLGNVSSVNVSGVVSGLADSGQYTYGHGSAFGFIDENYGNIINCHTNVNVTALNYDYLGIPDNGNGVGFVSYNWGNISNCSSIGNLSCVWGGGFAGTNLMDTIGGIDYYGNISNCFATGTVYGEQEAGGFIAYMGGGIISNCYYYGYIWGGCLTLGGFAGYIEASSPGDTAIIRDCYSGGIVYGGLYLGYPSDFAMGIGGFAGNVYDFTSTIERCYSSSDVYVVDGLGCDGVGGFAGFISDTTVRNCYATGSVYGDTVPNAWVFSAAGGFCGTLLESGSIENCYSIGSVTNSNIYLGGFTGRHGYPGDEASWIGSVTSCYWDKQTSGLTVSDTGTGKTTAEMRQQATFIGWNFSAPPIVWSIIEDVSYPYFLSISPMPIFVTSPTNFVATVISNSQIMLTWLDGSGTSTLVRMSSGGYPANTSSGTFLCNGSTQVYNCSNLTLEQNYFFRAWSYNSSLGLFSIPVDTSSIIHSGIRAAIPYPVSNFTVPGWYGDPGIPNIPLRDLFIDSASHIGCSPMVLISAVAIALAIAISVGIFLFSGSVMFGAFFGLIILIGGYWSAGMPVWIMLTYFIVAVSLYFVLRRA
jgi:hypothetical protein